METGRIRSSGRVGCTIFYILIAVIERCGVYPFVWSFGGDCHTIFDYLRSQYRP